MRGQYEEVYSYRTSCNRGYYRHLSIYTYALSFHMKEMKEMGVNMLITGGKTEATYSNKTTFSDFTKLE